MPSQAKSPQSCPTLCDPTDCSLPGSSVHGDSPGKNAGAGCRAHLQGFFPTQGSNPRFPCLLHWQTGSLPPEPLGKHIHIFISPPFWDFLPFYVPAEN